MRDLEKIANNSGASQDKFELFQMLRILNQIMPEKILEIGVHRGGMLGTMREAFPDAVLVGIEQDPQHLEFTDFNLIKADSHDPGTPKLFSTMGQFDFLFIDGDHNYAGVRQDYEMYSKLVRPGGIIAFHDIMRPAGLIDGVEVRQFFDELKKEGRAGQFMEIWAGPVRTDGPHPSDAPGIGVIFK